MVNMDPETPQCAGKALSREVSGNTDHVILSRSDSAKPKWQYAKQHGLWQFHCPA